MKLISLFEVGSIESIGVPPHEVGFSNFSNSSLCSCRVVKEICQFLSRRLLCFFFVYQLCPIVFWETKFERKLVTSMNHILLEEVSLCNLFSSFLPHSYWGCCMHCHF